MMLVRKNTYTLATNKQPYNQENNNKQNEVFKQGDFVGEIYSENNKEYHLIC